ncbi:MAG: hypothetical protein AAGC80_15955, partial [Rhodococcus sp. (in: high G+C Gram-positive bacteria)]
PSVCIARTAANAVSNNIINRSTFTVSPRGQRAADGPTGRRSANMASILDLISAVLIDPPPLRGGRMAIGAVRRVEAVLKASSFVG